MEEDDYNLIVNLINELIVKKYSEYIIELVGITNDTESSNLIFEFKLCKIIKFDGHDGLDGLDFIRGELRSIFKLVGLDEKYSDKFFWIDFDYYFVYNKE